MDKIEFDIYEQMQHESAAIPTISVEDLHDLTPRTLIYGYNISGTNEYEGTSTLHVFLGHDGLIHKLIDHPDSRALTQPGGRVIELHVKARTFFVNALIPTKRAYPARTDRHMAVLLAAVGYPLTFTNWTEPNAGFPSPFDKVTTAGLTN